MMQFSSNACTHFLMDKIGTDVINASLKTLEINHDTITYLTPLTLMPGYLADKPNVAIAELEMMDQQSYEKLSQR